MEPIDSERMDRFERDEKRSTRRRREARAGRRRWYALAGFAALGGLVVFAPSIASFAGMGRSALKTELAKAGWTADCGSIRMGWVTPLSVSQLSATGPSGDTQIQVEQIDVDLTVLDLIKRGVGSDLGTIVIRGVDVAAVVQPGTSSIEKDMAYWTTSDPSGDPISAVIEISEFDARLADATTKNQWTVRGGSGAVAMVGNPTDQQPALSGSFEGVLSDPEGVGGAVQTRFVMDRLAGQASPPSDFDSRELAHVNLGPLDGVNSGQSTNPGHGANSGHGTNPGPGAIAGRGAFEFELQSDSLPLSVVSLARTRFPRYQSSLPTGIRGDATGKLLVQGGDQWLVSAEDLNLREFVATYRSGQTWANHQARIDGRWLIREDRIVAENVQASTDFASLVIDADFLSGLTLAGTGNNPVRWLESIRGIGNAEIDLVAMERALPGLIPVRAGVELQSGMITARVNTTTGGNSPAVGGRPAMHRSRLSVASDMIRGRSGAREVRIEPVRLTAVVSAIEGDRLRADEIEFQSGFGSATGGGDLSDGNVQFDIDLGQLATMLQPLFDLGATPPTGSAKGKVRWAAQSGDQWRLYGDFQTRRLSLLDGFPDLRSEFDARGTIRDRSLARLDSAKVTVRGDDVNASLELISPVDQPSTEVPVPVSYQVETSARAIQGWLAGRMPDSIDHIGGRLKLQGTALVSGSEAVVGESFGRWDQAQVRGDFGNLAQNAIELNFQGAMQFPAATGSIDHLTLVGEAVSMAAAGSVGPGETKIDVHARAKLERLQSAIATRVAQRAGNVRQGDVFQPVGYSGQGSSGAWAFEGDVEGDGSISQIKGGPWTIDSVVQGKEIVVKEPGPPVSSAYQTGPLPRGGQSLVAPADRPAARVIWYEPELTMNALARWDDAQQVIHAERLELKSAWVHTGLQGDVLYQDGVFDVKMDGQSTYQMDEVSKRLTQFSGTSIDAQGTMEQPVAIRYVRGSDGGSQFDVQTAIGWQRAAVAGMVLGQAQVPVRVNETSVVVDRASIPVGGGMIHPAGTIHYRPGALSMQVAPGRLAESIELTPEITSRWMKFLAPVVVSAANVQGTVGVDIDEATVLFETPAQSRVRGRLNIGSATMTAGPMIERLIEGVEGARSIARTFGGQSNDRGFVDRAGQTLVTMPPQQVDFALDSGWVTHQRMFFRIDRAEVFTSGRVNVGGDLDMVAQVPLDARWLGSDLGGLAGRPIQLPIRGNLASPQVDSSAIGNLVTETAVQAGQKEVDRFLEKQLNRGIEKLFGK